MRQLVTYDRSDSAEVHCIVGSLIKKRWLQDAGWRIDVVVGRAVIGIHRRRGHAKFIAVQWLADLCQLAIHFERICTFHIAKEIAANDIQLGIVSPSIGITDFCAYCSYL